MSEVEIIDEPADVPVDEPRNEPAEEPAKEPEIPAPVSLPKPKQVRKKATPRAPPQEHVPQAPVVVVDDNFWSELLATRRELDRTARTKRFENLVKF
jgi:hypothetical protein